MDGRLQLEGSVFYHDLTDIQLRRRTLTTTQLLNAAITWKADGDRWAFQLWGRNRTGARRASTRLSAPTGDILYAAASFTFGAILSTKFGR